MVDELGDAALIAAARTGQDGASAELYHRHHLAALRFARSLAGSGTDAEDLVADAFARLFAALRGGEGPTEALRPYLLSTIRNIFVDQVRRAVRERPTGDVGPLLPGVPFDDPVVARDEARLVATAFGELPERWQTVLWHTEVEGDKPAVVASLLGISPNAVAALAYRAREGLRERYLQAHLGRVPDEQCRPTVERLGAHARGTLSKSDARRVRAHLDECGRCRRLAAELADINTRLGALLGPALLGPALLGHAVLGPSILGPSILASGGVAVAGASAAAGGPAAAGAAPGSTIGRIVRRREIWAAAAVAVGIAVAATAFALASSPAGPAVGDPPAAAATARPPAPSTVPSPPTPGPPTPGPTTRGTTTPDATTPDAQTPDAQTPDAQASGNPPPINPGGDPTPTATVSPTPAEPDADADLRVTLRGAGTLVINPAVRYTLVVANNGPGRATDVIVSVAVPSSTIRLTDPASGCVADADLRLVTCVINDLAAGGTATRTFTAQLGLLTIGLPVAATAELITTGPHDTDPDNNSSGASCLAVTALIVLC